MQKNEVKEHLVGAKKLVFGHCLRTLHETRRIKLKLCHSEHTNPRKAVKKNLLGKNAKVTAILQIKQIITSDGEVDIIYFIGNFEYSKMPPSLFSANVTMLTGTKANLVKAPKEKSQVNAVMVLPQRDKMTMVEVDVMFTLVYVCVNIYFKNTGLPVG